MKKNIKLLGSVLFIACVFCFNCKKESVDSFCTTARQTYLAFPETEGTVGYSDKYEKYVVIFEVNNPNNIDESIVAFPCDLTSNLKVVGTLVKLSGILKKFNDSENMTPEIGGQNLYFLELTDIKPKQ